MVLGTSMSTPEDCTEIPTAPQCTCTMVYNKIICCIILPCCTVRSFRRHIFLTWLWLPWVIIPHDSFEVRYAFGMPRSSKAIAIVLSHTEPQNVGSRVLTPTSISDDRVRRLLLTAPWVTSSYSGWCRAGVRWWNTLFRIHRTRMIDRYARWRNW